MFAVLSATTGTIGKEVGFRYDFGVFFVRPLFVIVLSNKQLSIYGGHLKAFALNRNAVERPRPSRPLPTADIPETSCASIDS